MHFRNGLYHMMKNEIFFKSIQKILTKQMDRVNNNQEVVYCEDYVENRVYCKICDKVCIDQF